MNYGQGSGIVASAATSVAATNSDTIYSSLPNTGAKSIYLFLGDFTIFMIIAMTVIAVAYKIAISVQAKKNSRI